MWKIFIEKKTQNTWIFMLEKVKSQLLFDWLFIREIFHLDSLKFSKARECLKVWKWLWYFVHLEPPRSLNWELTLWNRPNEDRSKSSMTSLFLFSDNNQKHWEEVRRWRLSLIFTKKLLREMKFRNKKFAQKIQNQLEDKQFFCYNCTYA